MTDKKKSETEEIVFTKEQLINSDRFLKYKDLLGALLADGESYTAEAASEMIENYMKGTVN